MPQRPSESDESFGATLGRRSGKKLGTNGAGLDTGYTYHTDNALATLSQNIAGSANDVTFGLSYLPGNQVSAMTVSKPGYVFNEPFNQDFGYTANRLNQVDTVNFGGAFTASLSYDGNGNLTGDGQFWTYAYDAENRLTSAAGTASTAAFGHDPIGRRAAKTVTGPVSSDTRYLYDGDAVIADTDASGTVLRRYVYGPGADEPLVMYSGAGTALPRFYMTDPLGSVIGLTDGTGVLLEQHSYAAFGTPNDWSAGGTGNPLRYTAQPFDAETGLSYYRARYYSPSLGRFLSPDPIGYGDGLNLYAYVGNDPVNATDPSGLLAEAAYQNTVGPNSPIGYTLIRPVANLANGLSNTAIGDPGAWASINGIGPPGVMAAGVGVTASKGLRILGNFGKTEGTVSLYIDITKPRSIHNRSTNVNLRDFSKNLEESGFVPSPTGSSGTLYTGSQGKYFVRPDSKSMGPSADFTPAGQKKPTMKIRLGDN